MNGAKSAAARARRLAVSVLAALTVCGALSVTAMPASALEAVPRYEDGAGAPSESGTPAPEEDERGYSNGDQPSDDETPDRPMPEGPDDFSGCPASGRPLELLI